MAKETHSLMHGKQTVTNNTGGPLSLGIDIGTSSVKVLVMDRFGNALARGYSSHDTYSEGKVRVVDAEAWWTSAVAALATPEVAGILSEVTVVTVTGNMSSIVLADAAGNPIYPAMLVTDQRGDDEIDALDDNLRVSLETLSNTRVTTSMTSAKLLWLAANRADDLACGAVWLTAKDFVRSRFVGDFSTDPTDGFNMQLMHRDESGSFWDSDLIGKLGLPLDKFPRILESHEVAGTVTAQAAEVTGLPAGIPVLTGMGDIAAAHYAGGSSDNILISWGTSTVMVVPVTGGVLPDEWRFKVTFHPLVRPGEWFAMFALLTGGLAASWYQNTLGDFPEIPEMPDPQTLEELIFVPHLMGTGTPTWDNQATGALLGITAGTSATDIYLAMIESLAYEIAEMTDLVTQQRPIPELIMTGGLAGVPFLRRLVADLTQIPTRTLIVPESSAYGAALLGQHFLAPDSHVNLSGSLTLPKEEHRQVWQERMRRYQAERDHFYRYKLDSRRI